MESTQSQVHTDPAPRPLVARHRLLERHEDWTGSTRSAARTRSDEALIDSLISMGLVQAENWDWWDEATLQFASAEELVRHALATSGKSSRVPDDETVHECWLAVVAYWEREFPERINAEMLNDRYHEFVGEVARWYTAPGDGGKDGAARMAGSGLGWWRDAQHWAQRFGVLDLDEFTHRVGLPEPWTVSMPVVGSAILKSGGCDESSVRRAREFCDDAIGWFESSGESPHDEEALADLHRLRNVLDGESDDVERRAVSEFGGAAKSSLANSSPSDTPLDESEFVTLGDPILPDVTLPALIERLEGFEESELPIEVLQAIQRRREEAVPELIGLIEGAVEAMHSGPCDYGWDFQNGPMLAFGLLCEFEAREALPAIAAMLTLPDEGGHHLLGDATTELTGRVMPVLVDSPESLNEILRRRFDPFTRSSMADTYHHWVRNGRVTREQAVEHLERLFREAITEEADDDHYYFVGGLASTLATCGSESSRELLTDALDRDLIDPWSLDRRRLEELLEGGAAMYEAYLDRLPPTGIGDVVEEFSHWAGFDPDGTSWEEDGFDDGFDEPLLDVDPLRFDPDPYEPSVTIRNSQPKVGRNEPCPCGSGKKHKRCCGRT